MLARTQSPWYPINRVLAHEVDRIDILNKHELNFHSSLKPYYRNEIIALNDVQESDYISVDNQGKPTTDSKTGFWNYFYQSPAHFLEFGSKDFQLFVNPILHLSAGDATEDRDFVFQNTRGLNIRGTLDGKLYFSSSIFENQRHFLPHISSRINRDKAIPGNGFYKPYQSSILNNLNGWDYLNAEGYVGVQVSKSVGIEFGHGRHFIGNGYHSLLLDNYSHNYFYLKFNTRFWKINYQNIFAELSAFGSEDNISNTLLPKKYMAAHFLDIDITKNFSIGLYEAIIFNRENHFEFQYLNPLILYRSVEQFLDSPDNVLIGLNLKWNIKERIQLYSQLMVDELLISEFTSNNGWWGNKYGLQLGLKYMDVLGIDHLDCQVEYNRVRPYTYTHQDTIQGSNEFALASYSHYNQPLAHSLGANFSEVLFKIRYQPIPKLIIESVLIFAKKGEDLASENYGGNILKTYETRIKDFDNTLGQGDKNDIRQFKFEASYALHHNLYLDLDFIRRIQDSEIDNRDLNTTYLGLGLRLNIARQRLDY